MPNKEGRYSIQAYLVCKSQSGYLHNVEVYAGKSQTIKIDCRNFGPPEGIPTWHSGGACVVTQS